MSASDDPTETGDRSRGELSFTDAAGERWTFTTRRRVRQGEESSVAVIVRSAFQTRVVTCSRDEWESGPDLARLLERSLPSGGSRGAKMPPPNPGRQGPKKSSP